MEYLIACKYQIVIALQKIQVSFHFFDIIEILPEIGSTFVTRKRERVLSSKKIKFEKTQFEIEHYIFKFQSTPVVFRGTPKYCYA